MYLRLAEPYELDIVYLMGFDVWGDGLSLDEYLSCCRNSGKYFRGTWYVLVEKEQVVSALIVYSGTFGLQEGSFGLGSVATPPTLRRKGYGSKLVNLVKAELFAHQNCEVLYLHSDIDQQFYKRLGFVSVEGSDCMYIASDDAEFKGSMPDYF
ncbi:GNAT family N-acetyltransferase [Vibrio pomeroyi]|uniref:GNAT family N-acetyltransferase n=1 Tax=Vibrio pomeroyi TaxID=198832 RepID=A0ABV4MV70_9VIBR|nr:MULTISPECIES: GNAT family N-acetyltransferase [unclassified Vibrio]UPR56515.1 GNAT family N-acetyltransferase [Vibrio sp. ED004]UPR56604.1 GNAT family N-acetyltransferase [Vibrio sp. ED004]